MRRPDFRRLWIGESTSALGSSVTSLALPLVAITVLHAGVELVAVLDALVWLPWVAIGLPAGALVDRVPRRVVMMICDLLSLAALVSVPLAVWASVLTLAQLVVVAVLIGSAEVFFDTAYRAFLPTLLPPEDLVEGNARLQGAESAAQVAGPGVAGLVAAAVGAACGLLLDAITFVVSLVCLRGLAGREQRVERKPRPLRAEIAEGVRFVVADPLLRSLTIFGAAANFVLAGFGATAVVFLVRDVGLGSGAAGLLIALAQVGGVAGAFLAPRLVRSFGGARVLLGGNLFAAPVAFLIPFTAAGVGLACFVVGAFVLACGITAGNVVGRGFTQTYVPGELMGRVNTSRQVVNVGLVPAGAVLGGVLAGAFGFTTTYLLLFGGLLAAALMFAAGPLRGLRDLPSRPAHTVVRPSTA